MIEFELKFQPVGENNWTRRIADVRGDDCLGRLMNWGRSRSGAVCVEKMEEDPYQERHLCRRRRGEGEDSTWGGLTVSKNLTIIELTVWLAMWKSTPTTADVTVTKIAGYVHVRILMNQWFFRIFGIHTFYATATLLNMHAMNMWLTDASGRWLWGRIDLCTHGVTTMLGVSWQVRRDTTQVMLGVSLRARWDTTLVYITRWLPGFSRVIPKYQGVSSSGYLPWSFLPSLAPLFLHSSLAHYLAPLPRSVAPSLPASSLLSFTGSAHASFCPFIARSLINLHPSTLPPFLHSCSLPASHHRFLPPLPLLSPSLPPSILPRSFTASRWVAACMRASCRPTQCTPCVYV